MPGGFGLADQDLLNSRFVRRQFQHGGGAGFGEFGEAEIAEVAEADVQMSPFDQDLAAGEFQKKAFRRIAGADRS